MNDEMVHHDMGAVQAQPVSDNPAVAILQVIAAAAADPRVDPAKMQAMLEVHERIMATQRREAFARAMAACQAELKAVRRDAYNESSKSRYARLETIDAATRPIITRHGFALSFGSAPASPGAVRVTCNVMHEAGHVEIYELEGGLDTAGPKGTANKTSIQGLGSTVSYLRRYLKLMIFDLSLTNEDDDGQGVGYIDEKQVNTLEDMMQEAGVLGNPERQSKFLQFMGVEIVSEIRRKDYQKAYAALAGAIRKNREGA